MLKCYMEGDTEISTSHRLLEDIANNLQSLSETDFPCELKKKITLAATTGNYFSNFRSFIQMLELMIHEGFGHSLYSRMPWPT